MTNGKLPLDGQARIAVQSELLTNEQLPSADADPRVAGALEDPLSHEYHNATLRREVARYE